MLNFPLHLTANLARWRFARRARPVQFIDAADVLHSDSAQPVSREKIRHLTSTKAPVIWIGGSEPLDHPGISHLVRALTQTGHFVFLETDGALLRRRIHEFQPVSRLFLTVHLRLSDSYTVAQTLRPPAAQLALEGIRAAQLSGFLIAVHARVQQDSDVDALASLFDYAKAIDVDGFIATSAPNCSKALKAAARKHIDSYWWQSFSKLVDPLLSRDSLVVRQISAPAAILPLDQDSSAHQEEVHLA